MKIRIGFVSNSSTSSFIIGIAAATDFSKAMKFARTPGVTVEDLGSIGKTKSFSKPYVTRIGKGTMPVEVAIGYNDVVKTAISGEDDGVIAFYFSFEEENIHTEKDVVKLLSPAQLQVYYTVVHGSSSNGIKQGQTFVFNRTEY